MNYYSEFMFACITSTEEINAAFAKVYKVNYGLNIANESKNYYTLASEGFKDSIKGIGQKVLAFFRNLFNKIKNFVINIISSAIEKLKNIKFLKSMSGCWALIVSWVNFPQQLKEFISSNELLNKGDNANKWLYLLSNVYGANDLEEIKELKNPIDFYDNLLNGTEKIIPVIQNTTLEFKVLKYTLDNDNIGDLQNEARQLHFRALNRVGDMLSMLGITKDRMLRIIKDNKRAYEDSARHIEESAEDNKDYDKNDKLADKLYNVINIQKEFIKIFYQYLLFICGIFIRYSGILEKYIKEYRIAKDKLSVFNNSQVDKEVNDIRKNLESSFNKDKENLIKYVNDKIEGIFSTAKDLRDRYSRLMGQE